MKNRRKPKISIITVVYNDVENIEETIKSVISQTYENFEYIVIDGNSDDGTVEIIKKSRKDIDYWVSELDKGIYDAMNKGIEKSTGELLFFLNSNDFFYNKDVLKNIAKKYLENEKPDILYGRMYFEFNEFAKKDGVAPQVSPVRRLRNGFSIYHQATFVKKEVFNKIGFFDIMHKVAGDYDFFCRCLVNGYSFFCIDEVISKFTYGGRGCNEGLCDLEKKEIIKKYFGRLGLLRYSIVRKLQPIIKKCLGFENLR